jgi:hypothetical protein
MDQEPVAGPTRRAQASPLRLEWLERTRVSRAAKTLSSIRRVADQFAAFPGSPVFIEEGRLRANNWMNNFF